MASTSNNFFDDNDIYHPTELRKRQKPNKITNYDKYYGYNSVRYRESAFVIIMQFIFVIISIYMAFKFLYYYFF